MAEQIKINSLVPPTWNRLKVNDVSVELPAGFGPGILTEEVKTEAALLSFGELDDEAAPSDDVLQKAEKQKDAVAKAAKAAKKPAVKPAAKSAAKSAARKAPAPAKGRKAPPKARKK